MTIKLVTKKQRRNKNDALFLRQNANRFRDGEIQGALVFLMTDYGYEIERVGLTIEQGLGLSVRCIHKLNREWDEYAVLKESQE